MLKACTALANTQLALASEGGKALVNGVPITAYGWQLQSHGDEGRTFSIVKGESTAGPFVGTDTTFLDEAFKAENVKQGREPNPDDPRRFRKRGSTGCGTTKSYKGFGSALRDAVGAVDRPAKKAKKTAVLVNTALELDGGSGGSPAINTDLELGGGSGGSPAINTDLELGGGSAPSARAAPASSLAIATSVGLGSSSALDMDWTTLSDVDLETVFSSKLTMDLLRQHGGSAARGDSFPDMLRNVMDEASIEEMQAILRSIEVVPLSSAAELRQQLALA